MRAKVSSMEELLASQTFKGPLERGQDIEGIIIFKNQQEIVLDLGLKSEGVISLREIPGDKNTLKVGDKVKAVVVDLENESGQVVLNLPVPKSTPSEPLDKQKWEKYNKLQTEEGVIRGTVTKITQFGVFVSLEEGIEGLIHSSKLGPDDVFEIGNNISVIIDSIDPLKNRISLSPVITSTKGLIYK